MLKENFIEYILSENKNPAFILDLSGVLVSVNNEATKLFRNLRKGAKLSALFIDEDLKIFEQLVSDVIKYDYIVLKKHNFVIAENEPYEILCSKFAFENQKFLFCLVNKTNDLKNKFIPTDCEVDELPISKELSNLSLKMIKEYPYSFIRKAKLSNEADSYKHKIWIKDKDNKIILLNTAYAERIGYSKEDIEGVDSNVLSKTTGAEYGRDVDTFLLKSNSNTKIVSEIYGLENKRIRIFKIPIFVNNMVMGIINLAEDLIIDRTQTVEILESSYLELLIIDENNNIISYKDELYDIADTNPNENLYKKNLEALFDEEFISEIERYRNNFREKKGQKFIHLKRKNGRVEEEYEILLQKLFSGSNVTGIAINIKTNQNKNKEKVVMYDSIIPVIPQPVFIYETDNLKFLNVNDAALQLYGYSREEFLQMDLTDLYAPEDIQTLIESANKLTKGNEFTGPWRQKRRDGKSIIVELSKSLIDYKGKIAHLNFIKDVTSIAENKQQFNYYKSVFENTHDLVIIVDKDGFIIFSNESVSSAIGLSNSELEKRPVISLVSDDNRARFNSMVLNSQTKSIQRLDIDLKSSGNSIITVNVVSSPVYNNYGDTEAFILIMRPVVEAGIVQLQQEVFTEEKMPEALDAGFLAHLFHEILTPINVIYGFAQELSDSIINPSEDQKEAVDIITENQKLLMRIMDNASEYISLETKKIEFNPEKVVFIEIIDDLQNSLRELIESKNKSFTYGKISSSLSLQTDKHKLITLLNLFFTFAINTTQEEKIYLSAYAFNADEGIISIKDNNSGITNVLIKKMKEILVADEEVVRRNHGISRFTLRLLRKLLFLLSGKVEEITKAGKTVELGIRFPLKFKEVYFDLPNEEPEILENTEVKTATIQPVKRNEQIPEEKTYQRIIEQPVPKIVEQPDFSFSYVEQTKVEKIEEPISTPKPEVFYRPPVEETPVSQFDLNKYSCLYVEDQTDSQILFKSQMRDLKSVQSAPSFEDAIPLLEKNKFDFIVMDMNLQGEYNGLDALRIIQRMPGNKSVPVIAVTAYVLPGDREKFIAAGFSDFISKPVMRDKLVDVLKRIFA